MRVLNLMKDLQACVIFFHIKRSSLVPKSDHSVAQISWVILILGATIFPWLCTLVLESKYDQPNMLKEIPLCVGSFVFLSVYHYQSTLRLEVVHNQLISKKRRGGGHHYLLGRHLWISKSLEIIYKVIFDVSVTL
jgi:hypothetical protein